MHIFVKFQNKKSNLFNIRKEYKREIKDVEATSAKKLQYEFFKDNDLKE